MDKLLNADLARLRPGDAAGSWDTASLDEELKERAEREGARREGAK
jgi:glutathione-regulated potassium-efflux system ancillary protein KefC/glutathione-regulated potassium-efflux system protein KefB